MRTIIEYTDQQPPDNLYPTRIISPSRSGPCCFSEMEEIGALHRDSRWIFQYKRCKTCGFAVRVIVRELPNEALVADLKNILATAFVRNVPDF